jgi:hypothetical protein
LITTWQPSTVFGSSNSMFLMHEDNFFFHF